MSTVNPVPPEEEPQRLCRLCLTDDDLQCRIFDGETESSLARKIFECTSVQIDNIPGVPGFLCEVCKSKLVICSQFISQCLKTDEKIRRIYAKQFELHEKSKEEESRQIEVIDYFVAEPTEIDSKQHYIIDVIEEGEELEGSKNEQETTEIEISLEDKSDKLLNLEPQKDPSWEPQILNKDVNTSQESDSIEVPTEEEHSQKSQEEQLSDKDKTPSPKNKLRYSSFKGAKNKCPICGVPQKNLKQHMNVHTGIKKHVCQYCNKAFAQRGNLTVHLNIHTGYKPHKCDQCKKSFGDPSALKLHKVNHTSEFKYHCNVCGRNFKYPHSLKTHMNSHNNERKYSCSFCDKAFITANVLKKHIRTHTGERPFRCDQCTKTFTSSWNLEVHQKTNHEIINSERKPAAKSSSLLFHCDLCQSTFGHKANLRKHMAIHEKQKQMGIGGE